MYGQQRQAEHSSDGHKQHLHVEGADVVGGKVGQDAAKRRAGVDNGEEVEGQLRRHPGPGDGVLLHVHEDNVDSHVSEEQTAAEEHVRHVAQRREIDQGASLGRILQRPNDDERKDQGEQEDERDDTSRPAGTDARL